MDQVELSPTRHELKGQTQLMSRAQAQLVLDEPQVELVATRVEQVRLDILTPLDQINELDKIKRVNKRNI